MCVPDEIKRLIENSGNNFHVKVAKWFQENDWHVIVSPYYMDQSQNKAREIDLIVEKPFPVHDNFGDRTIGKMFVRLFVECKYINQESVFWFTERNKISAENCVRMNSPFKENKNYYSVHHYLADEHQTVAKLFSSKSGRTQENDPFYKALNQVINGMVSMRSRRISIPTKNYPDCDGEGMSRFQYPLVVCNSFDKIFRVDFDSLDKPSKQEDGFLFEIQYAYIDQGRRMRNEHFLVDFIEYEGLDVFSNVLKKEIEHAEIMLSDAHMP